MADGLTMDTSREFQILLTFMRQDSGRAAMTAAMQDQDIDWRRLLGIANRHRVLPDLTARLKAYAVDLVPANMLRELSACQAANEMRVRGMADDLARIANAFTAEKIPMLLVKGPALAVCLYGHPAARLFSDLDILVSPADCPRARDVLYALGLQDEAGARIAGDPANQRHHLFDFSHRQYGLELHWCLTTRNFPRALVVDGLFAHSRTVEIHGHTVLTLGERDTLAYLCLHGTQHYWSSLRYLLDFMTAGSLLPPVDLDEMLPAIRRQGLSRPFAIGCRLGQQLLGGDMPTRLRLPEPGHLERHAVRLASAYLSADAPWTKMTILDSLLYRSVTSENDRLGKARLLWRTMFTPTDADYRWIRLPAALHGLYPGFRLIRRLGKGLAAVAQLRLR